MTNTFNTATLAASMQDPKNAGEAFLMAFATVGGLLLAVVVVIGLVVGAFTLLEKFSKSDGDDVLRYYNDNDDDPNGVTFSTLKEYADGRGTE